MSATVSYKHNNPEFEVETVNSTTPLMGDKKNPKPTLATPETDEQDDDREVVNEPYPGVDDGFFDNEKPTDSEVLTKRNNDTNTERREQPEINSKDDDQGKTENPEDENDGTTHQRRHSGSIPHFPRESDFPGHRHHEVDIGTGILLEDIPDLNVYQHKKTLAQGMMDLALFSANANQLRYVMDSFDRHPYYYPSLIFIALSLILQVAIGVLLIWNATYNVKDEKEVCRANKINNYTVIGIFLVTVVNVFVSAFGVADAPSSLNTRITANST
ncbi:ninjurin-A-like [Coccinella septempunctata]|uniref:ninjurin-A-like n=1 Tax=Coccinella septempunctata TaxID=41139 RepID=UPI001D0698CA|nr:ninjurin-A-like [Coccinella septempunctata]